MQELVGRMQAMTVFQEQMQQQNADLNARVAELTSQLQGQMVERQRQAEMAAAIERLSKLPEMLKDALKGSSGQRTLCGPKGLGKPVEFNNVEKDFLVWKRKTENFVCGVFEEAGPIMNSVLDRDGVVVIEDLKNEHFEHATPSG